MPKKYDDKIIKPRSRYDYCETEISELKRAKDDFPFFFSKLQFYHPTSGMITSTLNERQINWHNDVMNKNVSVLEKTRQCGMSLYLASLILWRAMFNKNQTIFLISNKLSSAVHSLSRLKDMYEYCPRHLKIGVNTYSKREVSFENDSNIICAPLNHDVIRGYGVDWLILEEAEFSTFYNHLEYFFISCMPLIYERQGKLILNWMYTKPLPPPLIMADRRYKLEMI
jgi:hypothetical protein